MRILGLLLAILYSSLCHGIGESTNFNTRPSKYSPLTPHWRSYAILNDKDAKIQFSFKYKIFHDKQFYFALTQGLSWSVFADSYPFKDILFGPEAFYRFELLRRSTYLDFGWVHKSNGKDGIDSRSVDAGNMRLVQYIKFMKTKGFFVITYAPLLKKGSHNDDYNQYVSNWKFEIYLNRFLGPLDVEFHITSGPSFDFDKGYIQAGLGYSFNFLDINMSLYVQYYVGYAENLLEYNQRKEEVRGGISFFY